MKKILIIIIASLIILIGLAALISSFFTFTVPVSFFANQIAVIPIEGEIATETSPFSTASSSEEIVEKLDAANKNPAIGAILLKINSPGGTVVATKQIVQKIRSVDKPTVAWITDMGASGAYYVAAACDYIVADADSITGSIGVLSIYMNFEELLEKIGVKVETLKAGEMKTMGSPFEELTEEEREIIQTLLNDAFRRFKNDIIEFRGDRMSRAEFTKIADGRVLSGEQAQKIGLIDSLGTKEDAVAKAAELAEIAGEPVLIDYGKKEITFFDLFSGAGYSFGKGFQTGLTSLQRQPRIES